MKVHVVSPKYIQIMQSTKVMIKGAFLKVLVATLIMFSIHMLQMHKITHADEFVNFSGMFLFETDL